MSNPKMAKDKVVEILQENLGLTCGMNCERMITQNDEQEAYGDAADAILALAAADLLAARKDPARAEVAAVLGKLVFPLSHAQNPDMVVPESDYGPRTVLGDFVDEIFALFAPEGVAQPTLPALDLDRLANRLMGWPIPHGMTCDLCMTMPDYPHPRSGTNMIGVSDARAMLEWLFASEVSK